MYLCVYIFLKNKVTLVDLGDFSSAGRPGRKKIFLSSRLALVHQT